MKSAFWASFALGMIGLAGCAQLFAGGTTPADEGAALVDEGVKLGDCEAKGRAAKDAGAPDAFGIYEDCTREAGLR